MAQEPVELHELWVDGKLVKKWTGKRLPAGIKRLFGLKGVDHRIKFMDPEGRAHG